MAHVSELWRYPVKSFQGERVDRVEVGPDGIVGDRRYAVTDPVRGAALSAKTEPRLLDAWATTEGGEVVVRLPSGATLRRVVARDRDRDLRAGSTARSASPTRTDGPTAYWMTLDPPNDEAEQYEIPMPPGTFFDLHHVHVLTTASLARCREARPEIRMGRAAVPPERACRRRRRRVPRGRLGRRSACAWVAPRSTWSCARCVAPCRCEPNRRSTAWSIERDLDVYRVLEAVHANDLGVYCGVAAAGPIAVGDDGGS